MEEKLEEERKEKERQAAEDMVAKMHEECSNSEMEQEKGSEAVSSTTIDTTTSTSTTTMVMTTTENGVTASTTTVTNTTTNVVKATMDAQNDLKNDDLQDLEDELDPEKKKEKDILTRSKTGSLTPRTFNIEDLRRKTSALLNREDPDKKDKDLTDTSRMTRLKSSQMANGTYLYKLGLDNQFKSYVNQYTTNPIALNKPQRNEERDKKRHLSHKFSLTTASEFKWVGSVNGSRVFLLNTVRQTILQLEQAIQTPFMHPNWHIIRKPWLSAVGACQQPKDFARAMIVLQACIKPVVFANVWHEQLGHSKLSRITAAEREERKKLEKREKKEREEEEERNRMMITGYVKYTMGFKHQLWKQKGEEYRIHGRWGWLWLSSTRNLKSESCLQKGLAAGPHLHMVQVRDNVGLKILAVDKSTYTYLNKKFEKDDASQPEIKNETNGEDGSGDWKKDDDGELDSYIVAS